MHLTALDWAAIAAYLLITLALALVLVSLTRGVALCRLMPTSIASEDSGRLHVILGAQH